MCPDAKYDVTLSLAGEDRRYVEVVAAKLREHGLTVFYDRYEEVELWGKDLYQHLAEVYQHRGLYCVIFLSEAYARRLWTRHELRSAQSRAFGESREYILPVRFADTALPGIGPTIGYIDLRRKTPEALAALILQKVQALWREEGGMARPIEASSEPGELGWPLHNQGRRALKPGRPLMRRLPTTVASALLWVLAVTFLHTISAHLSLWALIAPVGIVFFAYGVVEYVTSDKFVAPLVGALSCGFVGGGSAYLFVHDTSARHGFVFGATLGWL